MYFLSFCPWHQCLLWHHCVSTEMSLFSHNLHPVIKKWHLSSEGINYLVFIQTSQIFKRPLLNITQKISTSIICISINADWFKCCRISFSQNICVSPSILLLFINRVQTEVLSAAVKLKSKQDDSVYLLLYLL